QLLSGCTLKDVGSETNFSPLSDNPMIHFPDNYVAELRGKNYIEQWETYIKSYYSNLVNFKSINYALV
ncbi:hypothetical protein, partial [Vibrio algivorus]|uniref:hypothetical protein n=1 Tax=Vibrio algivorus TaxID=1667024 RepID=UPI001C908656